MESVVPGAICVPKQGLWVYNRGFGEHLHNQYAKRKPATQLFEK
jgi:hypothetical protein